MKRIFSCLLVFFVLHTPCKAVDDAPPIPVEITDDSPNDQAARLTFLIRDQMRASRTFRVVNKGVSRIHLFVNATPVPTAPKTLACSAIWTYVHPDGTTGLYLTSMLFTIGADRQVEAAQGVLTQTEKVFIKMAAAAAGGSH